MIGVETVERRVRMALAEVGMEAALVRVDPAIRWPGATVRLIFRQRTPRELRWRASETAAVGLRPARCFACYRARWVAWNAGRPEPEPCESHGRFLLADCGMPRPTTPVPAQIEEP